LHMSLAHMRVCWWHAGLVHDRMTEMPYPTPLETFETGLKPEPTRVVPIMKEGRAALEKVCVCVRVCVFLKCGAGLGRPSKRSCRPWCGW
jgi:hypothetical protein